MSSSDEMMEGWDGGWLVALFSRCIAQMENMIPPPPPLHSYKYPSALQNSLATIEWEGR